MKIQIEVSKEEHDLIDRNAMLEKKWIKEYCHDRCVADYTDSELEGFGFGLMIRQFRRMGYPDEYIKKFTGDMIRMLQDIPPYDEGYEKRMDKRREILMQDGLL